MDKEKMINPSMFFLRLIIGTIFIAHGAQKLFGMFGGIGIEGTAKMVEGLGFPNPLVVALIWACWGLAIWWLWFRAGAETLVKYRAAFHPTWFSTAARVRVLGPAL
ncbi:MAG: DoxX family membrane protein, partial [Candidatus Omnitrophota bacterium]